MTVRTRCLATLVLGLGLGTPVWADDGWAPRKPAGDVRPASGVADRPEVLPPVTTAADTDGRPDMLPPPATIPAIPTARSIEMPIPPDPPKSDLPKSDLPKSPTPKSPLLTPPAPPAHPLPPEKGCTTCPDVPTAHRTALELWAEVDYLQWWYRGGSSFPLVTSGSLADASPGALGQPGTRVLYGGGGGDAEWASGRRARLGGYVPGTPFGWEIGGFYTQPQERTAVFSGADTAFLARPLYDVIAGAPFGFGLGASGFIDSVAVVHTRTTFWGLEANATCALDCCKCGNVFVGYRFLQMSDELDTPTRSTVGATGLASVNGIGLAPGATILLDDRVLVRNEFHGAQAGWQGHFCYHKFIIDVRTSLAVGVGTQRVNLEGTTQSVDADGTLRYGPGGALIQPSNMGQFDRDRLTVVPEFGVRVSYPVAPGVSIHAGYDFLYWASVARAGDQLDYGFDPRQAPTTLPAPTMAVGARPVAFVRDTDFWAHGLSFGVRVEY
jgi:hypothetical protein